MDSRKKQPDIIFHFTSYPHKWTEQTSQLCKWLFCSFQMSRFICFFPANETKACLWNYLHIRTKAAFKTPLVSAGAALLCAYYSCDRSSLSALSGGGEGSAVYLHPCLSPFMGHHCEAAEGYFPGIFRVYSQRRWEESKNKPEYRNTGQNDATSSQLEGFVPVSLYSSNFKCRPATNFPSTRRLIFHS